MPIDERLLAESVAPKDETATIGVPDRDGKHSVEVREAFGPFVLVEMDDRFGVAIGAKLVAGAFEPATEVEVVIDFAVEDEPNGAVFVRHRLASGDEVDDREAAKAKRDSGHRFVRRPVAKFA